MMVKANQRKDNGLALLSGVDRHLLSHTLSHCFWLLSICFGLIFLIFCSGLLQASGLKSYPLRNYLLKNGYNDSMPNDVPAGLLTMPKSYSAPMTTTPLVIDGDLSDPAWQKAPWSERFSDIAGTSILKNARKDRTDQILPTQIKMCWDNGYLYIAAKLTEPDLWATLQKRDTIIYHNNDFEVFFSAFPAASSYYELEINQLGTLLDLLMTRPYRNGGQALIHWDLKGLKSAVKLHGTLNNAADKDCCWTVEMAIPFKGVLAFAQKSPQVGDYWRINFSRVQWDAHPTVSGYQRNASNGRLLPEHNWVWSPQGIINMHAPDRWGYVFFVKDSTVVPALPLIEWQKAALWKIYYAEQYTFARRQKFALTLAELGVGGSSLVHMDPVNGKKEKFLLQINAGKTWFRVSLSDQSGRELLALDQNGVLSVAR